VSTRAPPLSGAADQLIVISDSVELTY
jgi:hypothetical protein